MNIQAPVGATYALFLNCSFSGPFGLWIVLINHDQELLRTRFPIEALLGQEHTLLYRGFKGEFDSVTTHTPLLAERERKRAGESWNPTLTLSGPKTDPEHTGNSPFIFSPLSSSLDTLAFASSISAESKIRILPDIQKFPVFIQRPVAFPCFSYATPSQ